MDPMSSEMWRIVARVESIEVPSGTSEMQLPYLEDPDVRCFPSLAPSAIPAGAGTYYLNHADEADKLGGTIEAESELTVTRLFRWSELRNSESHPFRSVLLGKSEVKMRSLIGQLRPRRNLSPYDFDVTDMESYFEVWEMLTAARPNQPAESAGDVFVNLEAGDSGSGDESRRDGSAGVADVDAANQDVGGMNDVDADLEADPEADPEVDPDGLDVIGMGAGSPVVAARDGSDGMGFRVSEVHSEEADRRFEEALFPLESGVSSDGAPSCTLTCLARIVRTAVQNCTGEMFVVDRSSMFRPRATEPRPVWLSVDGGT